MYFGWILIYSIETPQKIHFFLFFSVLQATTNNITNITRLTQPLTSLTELNLSNNPITEWNDVLSLSPGLPNLKILALNECLIKNIDFPESYATIREGNVELKNSWFPSLTILQLSSCKIDNWSSIEALNVLRGLSHFKFKLNPVLEKESRETCRQLIIAAIKSLTYLNGSLIERQERVGAEVDFLKKYGKDYLSSKASTDPKQMESFLKRHPR